MVGAGEKLDAGFGEMSSGLVACVLATTNEFMLESIVYVLRLTVGGTFGFTSLGPLSTKSETNK